MEILHVTAECYPYAKAGGLGDVAGALPKYQQQLGHVAKVVLPMYKTKFLNTHTWDVVHKGGINLGGWAMEYTIIKEATNVLGFDLYCVDINGLLDREKIYGYSDDTERFMTFQVAVVDWLSKWEHQPDVVHVHDYHAGLVPFLMKYCFAYKNLANIKTILTIHNAQYQGQMDWSKSRLLPAWDAWQWGKLDWEKMLNPLAAAVKCVDKVTTVSPSYMEEIKTNANGLEALFEYEKGKCSGIINGIDNKVWDPATDEYLVENYNTKTLIVGKQKNKEALCEQFDLDASKPLMVFIGRLVGEKAADILPETFKQAVYQYQGNVSFLVLGSGESKVEYQLTSMNHQYAGYYNSRIAYNEALSHQMYAGADFLLMPSRVEPCGLNQLYALRYGTVPMVRNTGGLKDTVIDIGDNGYGFKFNEATVQDMIHTIGRGIDLYYNQSGELQKIRKKMMELNFSWENSAQKYLDLYQS
jgi:starch synthase